MRCESKISERPARFEPEFKLHELLTRFFGEPCCFIHEVKIEIDLRLVEVAQGVMVGVPGVSRMISCSSQGLPCCRVITSNEVQICDVVLRLNGQQRHSVLAAEFTRTFITAKRAR